MSPHLVPHLNDKGTCGPCRACHGTYLYIYLKRERYVYNKGTCQQRVAPCRPVSPRVPPVSPLCCPLLCKLCCGKGIHARCFLSRSIFYTQSFGALPSASHFGPSWRTPSIPYEHVCSCHAHVLTSTHVNTSCAHSGGAPVMAGKPRDDLVSRVPGLEKVKTMPSITCLNGTPG